MKMEMNKQNVLEEQLTVFGNWYGCRGEENEGIKDDSQVVCQGTWKNDRLFREMKKWSKTTLMSSVFIYN